MYLTHHSKNRETSKPGSRRLRLGGWLLAIWTAVSLLTGSMTAAGAPRSATVNVAVRPNITVSVEEQMLTVRANIGWRLTYLAPDGKTAEVTGAKTSGTPVELPQGASGVTVSPL